LVKWTTGGKGRGCHEGALVVDHLDGDRYNNALNNLVPACSSCNTARALIRRWTERTGRSVTELLS
jgi:hypothetical protein